VSEKLGEAQTEKRDRSCFNARVSTSPLSPGSTTRSPVLALACDCLTIGPEIFPHDAGSHLSSRLWRYSTGRAMPRVDELWGEAGFPVQGNPALAEAVQEGGSAHA
jgi:hypothetical protein